jgi:predicted nucleotidyltransferase
MLTLLTNKLPELERLCKLHGVKRLEVVGSAAREADFDPTRSDVDFLVEFEPGRLPATLSAFFGLREALARTATLLAARSPDPPRTETGWCCR